LYTITRYSGRLDPAGAEPRRRRAGLGQPDDADAEHVRVLADLLQRLLPEVERRVDALGAPGGPLHGII
jgi:hypothetical protein